MSKRKYFLFRLYDGSDQMSSFQNRALEQACQHFNWFADYEARGISVKIERMSNLDVRNKYKHITTFGQIIDWLIEDSDEVHVDAYAVYCHLHQGFMNWKACMLDLQQQFERLAEHGNGYPNKLQIYCPVFLQNKFEYLKLIPEFINPTIRIEIKATYTQRELTQIEAFWLLVCGGTSGGVLKAPYTTNRHWLKYVKKFYKDGSSKPSVENALLLAYNELYGSIPYVLLQPCIDIQKKRERKVVFLGGKASHVTTGFSVGRGTFPYEDETVINFAQKAYDVLIERLGPHHWLDQLCRVDVMYNEFEDRMVVNEVESLQACYEMKGTKDLHLDLKVESFLKDYHVKQIEKCVVAKLEEMLSL